LCHGVQINKRSAEQYKGTAWFQETLTLAIQVNWNDSVKEHITLADAA